LQIHPETLPLFVADGRIVENDSGLDPTFSAAAFTLSTGETSGIVETASASTSFACSSACPA